MRTLRLDLFGIKKLLAKEGEGDEVNPLGRGGFVVGKGKSLRERGGVMVSARKIWRDQRF